MYSKAQLQFVQVESKKLTASIGNEQMILLAKTDNDFYHPNSFFNISVEDNTAKVDTFFGRAVYERVGKDKE